MGHTTDQYNATILYNHGTVPMRSSKPRYLTPTNPELLNFMISWLFVWRPPRVIRLYVSPPPRLRPRGETSTNQTLREDFLSDPKSEHWVHFHFIESTPPGNHQNVVLKWPWTPFWTPTFSSKRNQNFWIVTELLIRQTENSTLGWGSLCEQSPVGSRFSNLLFRDVHEQFRRMSVFARSREIRPV